MPSSRAFSLVELLVVLALLGGLLALSLRVAAGVQARAARDRAQAELAVLELALEAYHGVHRRYPEAGDGGALLRSLLGLGAASIEVGGSPPRTFLSLTGFSLALEDPAAPGNHLVDPWQRAYVYRRGSEAGSDRYWLYSLGPDGREAPPGPGGTFDPDAPANRDNIYAPR